MHRNIVRFGGGMALGILVFGLVSEAHAETPFCSSQSGLVTKYLGPLVKPLGSPSPGNQTVGVEVVTLRLGEQPCFFNAGEIELGSGVAPDKNTIFELASMTKIFTTAILAMRSSQGLDVNAPVTPNLPPGYELRPKEQDVTFQQLATFTGGFWWDDPPDFTNGQAYSQNDFVKQVNSLKWSDPDAPPPDPGPPPVGPIPGERNLPTYNFYSNGSTGFLGQILMHMDSGKGQHYPFHATGFSNWISDNLTGPLNMPDTAVEPGGKRATGYGQKSNGKYSVKDPFLWVPWGAAGALRSNAADMLNFLAANICAHHAGDPACTGLPLDILTALKTAHHPNTYTPSGTLADPNIYIGGEGSGVEQGWAWRYLAPPVPNPDNVTPIISKDGGHPGFSTYIGFDPDKAYGLVILMNTGGVAAKAAGKEIIQRTP